MVPGEWELVELLERESELVMLLKLHMLDFREPDDWEGEPGGVCQPGRNKNSFKYNFNMWSLHAWKMLLLENQAFFSILQVNFKAQPEWNLQRVIFAKKIIYNMQLLVL